MEIYGTETEQFTTFLKYPHYKKGDVFGVKGNELIVVEKLPAEHFFAYKVAYPALIDDELENALQHFRFLRKYNLV
jgi:hypothetical protein